MKISLSLPMDVTSSLPLLSLFLSKYPDSLSLPFSLVFVCAIACLPVMMSDVFVSARQH